MNIISQDNLATSTHRPIAPKIVFDNGLHADNTAGEVNQTFVTGNQNFAEQQQIRSNAAEDGMEGIEITDNATTPSRVGSPTSISNLLRMELGPPRGGGEVMQTGTVKEDGSINFVGNFFLNRFLISFKIFRLF